MCTGDRLYRDQIIDEAIGVGNKVAWMDFDVQRDSALAENVLQNEKKKRIIKSRSCLSVRLALIRAQPLFEPSFYILIDQLRDALS